MRESFDMNPARFQELADAFGGDLDRWPANERAMAARLLAGAPSLVAVLDVAARLDRLLWTAETAAPSAGLIGRITAAAPRARAGRSTARRWAGAGLAAATVAGILVGVAAAPVTPLHAQAVANDAAVQEAARFLGEPSESSES